MTSGEALPHKTIWVAGHARTGATAIYDTFKVGLGEYPKGFAMFEPCAEEKESEAGACMAEILNCDFQAHTIDSGTNKKVCSSENLRGDPNATALWSADEKAATDACRS